MDLLLKNKRAIVCASSKGLGLAIAQELFNEGCDLVICSRNKSEVETAAETIAKNSTRKDRPHALVVDLSKPDAIVNFFSAAKNLLGGIDILVNNVGGPQPSSAEATTLEAWRTGFDQIFLSATLLTQAAIPAMKQQNFGRIITITSLSVLEPIDHLVVSTSMRTAVTAFMKTLSKEVASFGVTVNAVMPGVIHTDRIVNLRKAKAQRDGSTLEGEMDKTAQSIPMKRLGKPEELAALVAFLASPRASYITAANISVDGGLRNSWI